MTYNAIIDTMQIKTNACNVNIQQMNEFKDSPVFIRDFFIDGYGNVVSPISLNRLIGQYGRIESLSEYNAILEDFSEDILGVEDMEKVSLDRIDIAIDSDIDFDTNYRMLLYYFRLMVHSDKKASKWSTINLDDDKPNTIRSKSAKLMIAIYNKYQESKGHAPYPTRIEFRLKELSSMDLEKHIDKVIARINEMLINVDMVNRNMIELVCKRYDENISRGINKSLSEFVRNNTHLIYTREIMEGLLRHTGSKQSLNTWLRNFKASNKDLDFELFSKRDIQKFQKDTIKSLKNFKKN